MELKCPLFKSCGKSFSNIKLFRNHLKIIHAGQCFQLTCTYENCYRKLACYSTFVKHVSIHFNSVTDKFNVQDKNVTNICDSNNAEEIILTAEKDLNLNLQNNNDNKNNLDNAIQEWRTHLSSNIGNYSKQLSYEENVLKSYDLLVAKFYANPILPRNLVQTIINDFKDFYDQHFKDRLHLVAKKESENVNENIIHVLNVMHYINRNHKSEYKSFEHFKSLYYIEPKSVHVGTVLQSTRFFKRKLYSQKKLFVEMIQIKDVLRHFLELPNVFMILKDYIEKMEKCDCICSVVQSERWKEIKKLYNKKIVFPITCYGDDFEINNPLGSHRKISKIHSLYCTLSCIPREYSSLLENIFLLQLFKTEYKKMLPQSKLYYPAIQQMIDLQNNGITINIKNQEYKIYFHFYGLIGDNLELYSMLGFNECFRSLYPCRICIITRDDCERSTYEKKKTLSYK